MILNIKTRRRRKQQPKLPSPAVQFVHIVFGGAAGLLAGYLIILYFGI